MNINHSSQAYKNLRSVSVVHQVFRISNVINSQQVHKVHSIPTYEHRSVRLIPKLIPFYTPPPILFYCRAAISRKCTQLPLYCWAAVCVNYHPSLSLPLFLLSRIGWLGMKFMECDQCKRNLLCYLASSHCTWRIGLVGGGGGEKRGGYRGNRCSIGREIFARY